MVLLAMQLISGQSGTGIGKFINFRFSCWKNVVEEEYDPAFQKAILLVHAFMIAKSYIVSQPTSLTSGSFFLINFSLLLAQSKENANEL